MLELSKRRFIDPSEFIKHLGLDAGQQQDAQEFSKLFLSVLETNLLEGGSCNGHNVIKEQFCGQYAYVTRCNNCNYASERMSEFYELDLNIQGLKTLTESLQGFLGIERLDGDNKYMCSYCNTKQDATRAIELKSLPPVLNLQLLRFVFDIKTGCKKKLNSCIQFPDVLDMTEYTPNKEPTIYDLNAVLIHRGQSAYSGHYVAHIKGNDSQNWYKFNDEDIEKIKGKNLQLGSEEDLDGKKQKGSRVPKGHHSSKNAYMLVYTRRTAVEDLKNTGTEVEMSHSEIAPVTTMVDDSEIPLSIKTEAQSSKSEELNKSTMNLPVESRSEPIVMNDVTNLKQNNYATLEEEAVSLIPDYVLKFVERDNNDFEKWIVDMNEMKENNIAKGQEKQETVKAIYHDLPYTKSDGNNFEWIPMSWVSKWLNDPATAPKIDVSKFVCNHGRLCPDQSLKMKCISGRGSDQLYGIYGGELRLQGDESLCFSCVRQKCNIIRNKQRMVEDDKFISSRMKTDITTEKLYWIGKGSFRSWRRLAVELLMELYPNSNSSSNESINTSGNELEKESDTDKENSNLERSPDDNTVGNSVSDSTANENCIKDEHDSTRQSKSESNINTPNGKKNGENTENNDNDDETLQFNEDLLCESHKGLDPDSTCRKLVPESVWLRLKHYFPNCAEFDISSPPCQMCAANIVEEIRTKEQSRQLASIHKSALLDLFHDRKRPSVINATAGVFVVSTDCLNAWRQYVRDPLKNEPVTYISNASLLCEHEKYVFPVPQSGSLKSDDKITYVSAVEWQQIKMLFQFDKEIEIFQFIEDGKLEVKTIPSVCDDCLQRRLNMEECELFEYDKGIIYVRKQPKMDKIVENSNENSDSNMDDPEFSDKLNGVNSKKRESDQDSKGPPEKVMKNLNGCKVVRKSQRHRRAKGEKEVNISSKQTLKELKLEIMRLFSVAPYDQNLYVDGRLLQDNERSLCDLRVASGSVIDLIADEPQEETSFLDVKESGIPESGFKGTNLLST
ncbi:CDC5 cell division cycle 5-like protein [Mactra antiquata]